MTELEAIRTFFRFNSRVRQNYLDTILKLPSDERLKDRGASFPSLQEVFCHVLDGIRWWVEYVPQDRAADANQLPARELSPEQLRAETEKADRMALDYVTHLTEADMTKDMVCHFPGDDGPQEARFPIKDVLWHLVEEELQHRGELNALLWQIDVEPPIAKVEDWNASKEK
ncbi:MAG: DinB family protein [Euryarchaeota archaeon]|nr:DinB family protein [Euryarchaeota archaeon]MDE1836722.1 DinB family protein [Euryarchaeota archaeon]MDE1881751.1 DinB family protein [Euryarchaeota archaeon]MDE2044706.1 DinB family protein [Thermoplasmata archaeon]